MRVTAKELQALAEVLRKHKIEPQTLAKGAELRRANALREALGLKPLTAGTEVYSLPVRCPWILDDM